MNKKTKIFIEKVQLVYGDKYSYNEIEYNGYDKSVKNITCKIHGKFNKIARKFLKGYECSKCKKNKEFIEKSKKKFGDKFDYTLLNYQNQHAFIILICNIHNKINIHPGSHLKSKTGCPKCSSEGKIYNKKITINNLLKNGGKIHGNKYDYSNIKNIKNSKIKLNIICKKHNININQSYNAHIQQEQGCPICCSSKGEQKVYMYLKNRNINFKREKCITFLGNKYRFDFYIDDIKTYIEYDGKQHFLEDTHFNNIEIQHRDSMKNAYICNKNYNLIRIHYKDIKKIEKVLDKYLPKCNKETSQIYFSRDKYYD
jgi:very-short-patch-repair endonuclease